MCRFAALLSIALLFLGAACSSPSPTENTAELTREVRCRMSAQRSCAAEGGEEIDEYTRNQCIANRAWDCIMDQTPADMRERYAPAPVSDSNTGN